MARERGDRYANVVELADDLRAYMEGRVVRAYETGAWAESRKWIQRNRSLAASLLTVALLLTVGLIASLVLKAIADEQRGIADANAEAARENESEAIKQRGIAEENERLAKDNEKLALKNEAEALRQKAIAERERSNVFRLSTFRLLSDLKEDADLLWPVRPGLIEAYEDWLEAARALIAGLDRGPNGEGDGHRALLESLQDAVGRRGHSSLQTTSGISTRGSISPTLVKRWWLEQLEQLVAEIEAFADTETGLVSGVSPDHGWGIERRLESAKRLRDGFAVGGAYARRWDEARNGIAATYLGLDLPVQVGLVPMGSDPDSGLWEFWHVLSGDEPTRDENGRLVMTGESGIVLVLLPGGTFTMGAQSEDPTGENFDSQARDDEGPVHEVTLTPFFISKYEMTQGQWTRFTGHNPSYYQESGLTPTLPHPVDQLSWFDCLSVMGQMGLSLPSEAQWEYGARGGTTSPWWTGEERDSLRQKSATNLADQAARRAGAEWSAIQDWPELDDGHAVHAPVGTYAANPFGLHEVHGNVWEICLDGYDEEFYQGSPATDPVSPHEGSPYRVIRGGSFDNTAAFARSAHRNHTRLKAAGPDSGLRPARAIER